MRSVVPIPGALLAALLLTSALGAEPVANGFDLGSAKVPAKEIVAGGPDRDGIRSVDAPAWAAVAEASAWVAPSNPVLGVRVGDEARTVPLHLIEYHQIVNAEVGGQPLAITYDPLTGTPRAFVRRVGERVLELGVSGLVYNGSFLMYDRQTESLWLHYTGEAIAGPLAGERLERLRVRLEPLATWLSRNPEASVLERPLPRKIDYRYSPFSTYIASDAIPFPVKARDDTHHPKEMVLGVATDGTTRAYLSSAVVAAGGRVRDQVEDHAIELIYDVDEAVFSWEAPPELRISEGFWFAWKAFHPDTEIWEPAAQAEVPEGPEGTGRGHGRAVAERRPERALRQGRGAGSASAESRSGS